MQYVILAGGFATRLWPLTEKRAKPLLLVSGKTILASIYKKVPEGASVLLLTNKRFEEDFKEELIALKRDAQTRIFCEDSFSDNEKLGAVKALSMALQHYKVEESVCVIAGDNILPELIFEDLSCHDDEARLAVREVKTLQEARQFGVIEQEGERVLSFVEKPEKPASKMVSTGFMAFGKNLIPLVHACGDTNPDSLGSIFTEFLCHDKEVIALPVAGEWFDVGSFETYIEAHKALQKKDVLLGEGVVHKKNIFSGKVFIGKGAVIENCRLHDTLVYPGVTLKNCHVSRSVIDHSTELEKVDLSQKLIRSGTIVKG